MACAGSFEVLSLLAKKGWEDQAEMIEGKRERDLPTWHNFDMLSCRHSNSNVFEFLP